MMKIVEYYECKELSRYDNFIRGGLEFDGLTIKDYEAFMPILFEILPKRKEKEPVLMYEKIIEELRKNWTASKELPFHGPWHHGIVAGVLITSLRNNGYEFTDDDIREALKRGLMTPAGACGFIGACGAGVGIGIAVSIILRSTPFHDDERSKGIGAVAENLMRLSKLPGGRCCRMATYATLEFAVEYLAKMGYNLPKEKMSGRCEGYYGLNEGQCHKNRCPYF